MPFTEQKEAADAEEGEGGGFGGVVGNDDVSIDDTGADDGAIGPCDHGEGAFGEGAIFIGGGRSEPCGDGIAAGAENSIDGVVAAERAESVQAGLNNGEILAGGGEEKIGDDIFFGDGILAGSGSKEGAEGDVVGELCGGVVHEEDEVLLTWITIKGQIGDKAY